MGKITICLYYEGPASSGSWPVANAVFGEQKINLNTYAVSELYAWCIGAYIAHETSHILFCNYTNGAQWGKTSTQMWTYYFMFAESLARYTADQSYLYGKLYSASQIKGILRHYRSMSGKLLSWYEVSYFYNNPEAVNDVYLPGLIDWQFQAMGYYFTNGNWNMGYMPLMYTLYYLKAYSSKDGVYLRSSSVTTCRTYFEYAFYKGYGYRANAGWIYARWYDTNYLYGKWHSLFFVDAT